MTTSAINPTIIATHIDGTTGEPTTSTDPVSLLSSTTAGDAVLAVWLGQTDTPHAFWPTDDHDACHEAVAEWIRRDPDAIFTAQDGDDGTENDDDRVARYMSAIAIGRYRSATTIRSTTPATLDFVAQLLAAAGYHRHASASAAGHAGHTTPIGGGFRQVFWIEPDGEMVVVQPDGSKLTCGDDGDGMVAGDDPVDDLGDVAAALALVPTKAALSGLRTAAANAGDTAMVAIVDRALEGDFAALIECGSRLAATDDDDSDGEESAQVDWC